MHQQRLGRNNFQYYSEKLHEKSIAQSDLENMLKFAVERNQMFLKYQPIFDLTNKEIIGIEALCAGIIPIWEKYCQAFLFLLLKRKA